MREMRIVAALGVKAGTIVGKCMPRRGSCPSYLMKSSRTFRPISTSTSLWTMRRPIGPNSSASGLPSARRWHIHFTPTSSSWINQVERLFALPAEQQIKRAISIDQTSRRHFRFVGTLLSSDDQPLRTDSIVLAILASPFKSKREFLWMFIRSLRGKLKLANLSLVRTGWTTCESHI
jgi:hypothetical protein